MQNPFKINCFLPVAGSEPKFNLKWIIFRPWPDRRRLGEEEKGFSPYRRGMRFLMLMRYRGGQPPSHHTVVTSDVRNSFLPEMPKVQAIWHLSVYFLGWLLTTILVVSATPKKTSVPSRAWKKDRVFHEQKLFFVLPISRLFPNVIQFSGIRAKRHSWPLVWSLIWEWPKVHCDKPAPKQMPLNKICNFFVFFTSFSDRARKARCFCSGRPYPKPFQHTVEKEKNQDKKNSRTFESCVRREFCPEPFLHGMLFFRRPKKMNLHATVGAKKIHGHNRQPPKNTVPSIIALFSIAEHSKLLAWHPNFDLILSAILNGTARFALIASKAEVDR